MILTSGFMIPGGACRISSTAMTIYWNASEIYWFHQFDSEYPNLREKNIQKTSGHRGATAGKQWIQFKGSGLTWVI